jgi:hypothetical protein
LNVDKVLDTNKLFGMSQPIITQKESAALNNLPKGINVILGNVQQQEKILANTNNENWEIYTPQNLDEGLNLLEHITNPVSIEAGKDSFLELRKEIDILYMQTHGGALGVGVLTIDGGLKNIENADLSDFEKSKLCYVITKTQLEQFKTIKNIMKKYDLSKGAEYKKFKKKIDEMVEGYMYPLLYNQIQSYLNIIRKVKYGGKFIIGGCMVALNYDQYGFSEALFEAVDRPDLTIYSSMNLVEIPAKLLDIAIPNKNSGFDGWGYINASTGNKFKPLRPKGITLESLKKGDVTGRIILKSKGNPLEIELLK